MSKYNVLWKIMMSFIILLFVCFSWWGLNFNTLQVCLSHMVMRSVLPSRVVFTVNGKMSHYPNNAKL